MLISDVLDIPLAIVMFTIIHRIAALQTARLQSAVGDWLILLSLMAAIYFHDRERYNLAGGFK